MRSLDRGGGQQHKVERHDQRAQMRDAPGKGDEQQAAHGVEAGRGNQAGHGRQLDSGQTMGAQRGDHRALVQSVAGGIGHHAMPQVRERATCRKQRKQRQGDDRSEPEREQELARLVTLPFPAVPDQNGPGIEEYGIIGRRSGILQHRMAHHQGIEAEPVEMQRLVPALQGIVTEPARNRRHLIAGHRAKHADRDQDQAIFAEVTQPRLQRRGGAGTAAPGYGEQRDGQSKHGKRWARHHDRQAVAHHHGHDHQP